MSQPGKDHTAAPKTELKTPKKTKYSGTRLCARCKSINLHDILSATTIEVSEYSGFQFEVIATTYSHFLNAQDLFDDTGKRCRLCKLFKSCVAWSMWMQNIPSASGTVGRQDLLRDPLRLSARESTEAIGLVELGVHLPIAQEKGVYGQPSRSLGYVSLSAAPDSPAALEGRVAGRPSLKSSCGQDAMDLIRSRLNTCVSSHAEKCSKGIGGALIDDDNRTPLPTRLIHINRENHRVLRLVETDGQVGRYATLSHCWGPPSNKPICTSRSNVQTFSRSLPWELLPKTFQDAIVLCHDTLSLEYLWIDSICIIQDDLADWENEALKMGQYYQNSFITIAAAYARSANEGLFFDRNTLKPDSSVEIPYINSDGQQSGTLYVNAMWNTRFLGIAGNGTILSCPLNNRAWVFQEQYLSRRIIYFLERNIEWHCCQTTISETGQMIAGHIEREKLFQWEHLVHMYTYREITYESDTLKALAGIATELAKVWPGSRFVHGLWTANIHDHLLWYRLSMVRRNSALRVPSWSWASLIGNRDFFVSYKEFEAFRTPVEIYSDDIITLSDCKSMQLGYSSTLRIRQQCVEEEEEEEEGIPSLDPTQNRQTNTAEISLDPTQNKQTNTAEIVSWSDHDLTMAERASKYPQLEFSHLTYILHVIRPLHGLGTSIHLPIVDLVIDALGNVLGFCILDRVDWQEVAESSSFTFVPLITETERTLDDTEIYWCLVLQETAEGRHERKGVAVLCASKKIFSIAPRRDFHVV